MQNLTLSITQLNNYIKNIFDNEELLLGVSVFGEVTNFKISGNIAYFDIKEEGAQLSCVKFSTSVPFAKNGDKVIVTGRLNYHVRLGRLSFVVSRVELYGMGELYQKYLELKGRLEAEGYFDVSKKKPIPKYAQRVGVVTSETGAVIRDIYNVTRSKNPFTDILVYPSRVQGVGAEQDIVKGIEYFNRAKNVDVIIVARGGGSFEDLSPFNTEAVAMAAFKSEIPIISAIGHETDFSILDFTADMRAPTPSVAADLAVFNFYEEQQYIEGLKLSIIDRAKRLVNRQKEKIAQIDQGLIKSIQSSVNLGVSELSAIKERIKNLSESKFLQLRSRLEVITAKLEKSNPITILRNGYSRVLKNGKSVSIKDIRVGDDIETIMHGGKVTSHVVKVKED